ncbi:MAG: DUF4010 domain-containing protein [Hyphomicrobiaceae bacterium]|nr:MAG: DUF4010 domain-containing protein [Hyphomicrobiaceae bacterium]
MRPAVAGAVLSTVATVVQLALVLAATSPAVMSALALPLLYAGLAAVAYGAPFAFRASPAIAHTNSSYGDALSLRAALVLAATFGLILLAVAAMRAWFGDNGILVAAAISGLADGLTTNTLTKSVLAFTSGNRPFAWRIVPGLLLVLVAAWVGFYRSQ